MELSTIISIAGKPGLYQVLNQSRNGVVVASLEDGKKMVIGQTQRVSSLSDISVYTYEGDEPLQDVFMKFHANSEGEITLDLNDKDALRNFFLEVMPDHDEERVYASDIKKIIKWYNLLLSKNMLDFSAEEASVEEGEASVEERDEEKKAD